MNCQLGILLYDADNYTVKWSNPYANKVFGYDIENQSLEQLTPLLHELVNTSAQTQTFIVG